VEAAVLWRGGASQCASRRRNNQPLSSMTATELFAQHKARQQTDLLHFSTHRSTELAGPFS
jgi:hypothetical protein